MKDVFHASGFGKVAPWVDLVNSEEWDGFGSFYDRLENPDWVASFLRHWHLPPQPTHAMPLAQLRDLRKLMRRAVASAATNKARPSPRDLNEINQALAVPARQQLVKEQRSLRLQAVPERTGWDWVVAEIARGFTDWLLSEDAGRIKICQNDECRWLFYDATKARIKRWCSGKSCGNRMRVRRARAKSA
jgi:predicted RNA-binding Zn ribbon-like protein